MNAYPAHLSVPFRIESNGRPARTASLPDHVRDELVQLILTNQGERAFVPDFGTNVRRLVFENVDDTTRALAKSLVTRALSRWLGSRLTVEALEITRTASRVQIDVQYSIPGVDESCTVRFSHSEP